MRIRICKWIARHILGLELEEIIHCKIAYGPAIALAAVGLAVAAGGASYQAYEANEQSDKADAQMAQQKVSSDKLLKDQEDAQAKVDQEKNKEQAATDRNSARLRQRALGKGAYGRSDTILTGPLGVTTPAPTAAPKTLLGQ